MKLLFTFSLLFLILIPGSYLLQAQESSAEKSIGELIDDSGYLKDDTQYSGKINLDGWNFSTDPTGKPVFKKQPGNFTSQRLIPGDEKWDTKYGLPGVTGNVYTLLYTGTELYAGGSFSHIGRRYLYRTPAGE